MDTRTRQGKAVGEHTGSVWGLRADDERVAFTVASAEGQETEPI